MNIFQFGKLAPHYDALMAGVPYRLWVNYIEQILKKINYQPKSILDVACGTGTVSDILYKHGYNVTGFDLSEDMIESARTKHPHIEFHAMDAETFEFDKKFDMAVSLFDSLNYIIEPQKLASSIKQVGKHLKDGGIFIFDVNTIYALSNHFFDQANLDSTRYPKYIWNSQYDHSTRICTVNMTFEVLEDNEVKEFREVHVQKGYTLEELTGMLVDASFEVIDIYNAYKFRKPTRRSDRVFFVARKVDNG
jgi:SAM-dependent methyltransferase